MIRDGRTYQLTDQAFLRDLHCSGIHYHIAPGARVYVLGKRIHNPRRPMQRLCLLRTGNVFGWLAEAQLLSAATPI